MKYLKYAIGIIAILLIGFLALGFIKPNVNYECEILVDKNSNESWEVLQDVEKLPEWLQGFQKIEHISGTPGEVGAVSMVYFDYEGESMSIKETITNVVPNESISMLYESEFMNMEYKLSFTSINKTTKIITITTAEGNGIISKSILALMGSTLKHQEEENLINLKKAIEQNTKNYFQSKS
jgi:carbon monoxide dehydrogenase subunit G